MKHNFFYVTEAQKILTYFEQFSEYCTQKFIISQVIYYILSLTRSDSRISIENIVIFSFPLIFRRKQNLHTKFHNVASAHRHPYYQNFEEHTRSLFGRDKAPTTTPTTCHRTVTISRIFRLYNSVKAQQKLCETTHSSRITGPA